jgi:hypothetical protein
MSPLSRIGGGGARVEVSKRNILRLEPLALLRSSILRRNRGNYNGLAQSLPEKKYPLSRVSDRV